LCRPVALPGELAQGAEAVRQLEAHVDGLLDGRAARGNGIERGEGLLEIGHRLGMGASGGRHRGCAAEMRGRQR
jgi:hypothetical protein